MDQVTPVTYTTLPTIFGYGCDNGPLTARVVDFVALLAGHQFRFVAGHPTDLANAALSALPAGSNALKGKLA